jgi:hypothetical protein
LRESARRHRDYEEELDATLPRARIKGEERRATVKNAATNVLFDQLKIVSRDLHRQPDSQTGFEQGQVGI